MEKISKYKLCKESYKQMEGSYGLVRKVQAVDSGQYYAMKELKQGVTSQGMANFAIRQLGTLQNLKHPNIVSLKETIIFQNKFYLVFDYYQMNLREFMLKYSLNSKLIKKILFQLLSAVSYAHSLKFMHRDLKPDNILVKYSANTQQITVVLADWGLSRMLNQNFIQRNSSSKPYTIQVTALAYRAPQILLQIKNYNQKIDVWSIGCIFAQLIIGSLIFQGKNQITQLHSIISLLGLPDYYDSEILLSMTEINFNEVPKHNENKLKNIIPWEYIQCIDLMMLQLNPSKRISCENALLHPWFKEMN